MRVARLAAGPPGALLLLAVLLAVVPPVHAMGTGALAGAAVGAAVVVLGGLYICFKKRLACFGYREAQTLRKREVQRLKSIEVNAIGRDWQVDADGMASNPIARPSSTIASTHIEPVSMQDRPLPLPGEVPQGDNLRPSASSFEPPPSGLTRQPSRPPAATPTEASGLKRQPSRPPAPTPYAQSRPSESSNGGPPLAQPPQVDRSHKIIPPDVLERVKQQGQTQRQVPALDLELDAGSDEEAPSLPEKMVIDESTYGIPSNQTSSPYHVPSGQQTTPYGVPSNQRTSPYKEPSNASAQEGAYLSVDLPKRWKEAELPASQQQQQPTGRRPTMSLSHEAGSSNTDEDVSDGPQSQKVAYMNLPQGGGSSHAAPHFDKVAYMNLPQAAGDGGVGGSGDVSPHFDKVAYMNLPQHSGHDDDDDDSVPQSEKVAYMNVPRPDLDGGVPQSSQKVAYMNLPQHSGNLDDDDDSVPQSEKVAYMNVPRPDLSDGVPQSQKVAYMNVPRPDHSEDDDDSVPPSQKAAYMNVPRPDLDASNSSKAAYMNVNRPEAFGGGGGEGDDNGDVPLSHRAAYMNVPRPDLQQQEEGGAHISDKAAYMNVPSREQLGSLATSKAAYMNVTRPEMGDDAADDDAVPQSQKAAYQNVTRPDLDVPEEAGGVYQNVGHTLSQQPQKPSYRNLHASPPEGEQVAYQNVGGAPTAAYQNTGAFQQQGYQNLQQGGGAGVAYQNVGGSASYQNMQQGAGGGAGYVNTSGDYGPGQIAPAYETVVLQEHEKHPDAGLMAGLDDTLSALDSLLLPGGGGPAEGGKGRAAVASPQQRMAVGASDESEPEERLPARPVAYQKSRAPNKPPFRPAAGGFAPAPAPSATAGADAIYSDVDGDMVTEQVYEQVDHPAPQRPAAYRPSAPTANTKVDYHMRPPPSAAEEEMYVDVGNGDGDEGAPVASARPPSKPAAYQARQAAPPPQHGGDDEEEEMYMDIGDQSSATGPTTSHSSVGRPAEAQAPARPAAYSSYAASSQSAPSEDMYLDVDASRPAAGGQQHPDPAVYAQTQGTYMSANYLDIASQAGSEALYPELRFSGGKRDQHEDQADYSYLDTDAPPRAVVQPDYEAIRPQGPDGYLDVAGNGAAQALYEAVDHSQPDGYLDVTAADPQSLYESVDQPQPSSSSAPTSGASSSRGYQNVAAAGQSSGAYMNVPANGKPAYVNGAQQAAGYQNLQGEQQPGQGEQGGAYMNWPLNQPATAATYMNASAALQQQQQQQPSAAYMNTQQQPPSKPAYMNQQQQQPPSKPAYMNTPQQQPGQPAAAQYMNSAAVLQQNQPQPQARPPKPAYMNTQ